MPCQVLKAVCESNVCDCNSSFHGKKCECKKPTYSRPNANLDNQNTSDFGVYFRPTLSLK